MKTKHPTRTALVAALKLPLILGAVALAAYVLFAMAAATESSFAGNEDPALQKKLTPLQYQVTQKDATEPPFRNEYWDNKREGLYVCLISGEPLFSSKDKFDSGTGWPSFTKPIDPAAVENLTDSALGMSRTEVRSMKGKSHLGHVFDDGPPPTGMRYCINSAALRFVPTADLEKEGYGKYRVLFDTPASSAQGPTERAVLGAGCFWCVEEIYEAVPGVQKVVSGYAGGTSPNPTYHSMGTGKAGHAEVVEVTYDPAEVSYKQLLQIFWETHDPTDSRGVSPDFGTQYRSIILPVGETQLALATASKARAQEELKKPIATEVKPLATFYPAEDYHQDYVKKNPNDPYVRGVSRPRFERVNLPAILKKSSR